MRARRSTLLVELALALILVACGGGGEEPAVEGTTDTESETAGPATSAPTGAPADAPAGGSTPTTVSAAPSGVVIQTQEPSGVAGLVAELYEATREDGVLTVKVRFRNTGTEEVYKGFETHHGDYRQFYVTAENQKYFVLKDSDGAPLAPTYLDVRLEPGQTSTWWAKFPAPPAGVAEFDLVMHETPPFENIPITDR
jgi:hypothetical protein